jgi:hypothetical protein
VLPRYRQLSRFTLRTKRPKQILCGRNAALSVVKACAGLSYCCHNTGQNGCQATQRPWPQIASILQYKRDHIIVNINVPYPSTIRASYYTHLRLQYQKTQPHPTSVA